MQIPRKILLMYSTHRPAPEHLQALASLGDDLSVVSVNSEEDALRVVNDAEIILGHRYLRQSLPAARRLKWVQSSAGGVDKLPLQMLAGKEVLLTRCSAPSGMIARHAYTMAWALLRNLPVSIRNMDVDPSALRWLPRPRVALIIGMGNIGCELAAFLKQDGIDVWGVKRRTAKKPDGCDRLFGPDEWQDVVSEVDLCFMCLPLTQKTRQIMNADALSRLPDHAVVVNVGRGATVDEAALLTQLKEGRLGGAGLDVLAPDSPFAGYRAEDDLNLIITPHVSSHYLERSRELEQFFERQVAAYLHNEPLQNVVEFPEGDHG